MEREAKIKKNSKISTSQIPFWKVSSCDGVQRVELKKVLRSTIYGNCLNK